MPAKVKDVRQMLVGKLQANESEGKGHMKFNIVQGDQLVARTVLSRSYTEISDKLLGDIGRQLGVKRSQMNQLLECTWSRDDYISRNGASSS